MSSDVDICNLALSHLGDSAGVTAITPPDGTTQAGYCATYYPLARDALLEMYPWPFATKRALLTPVTNPSPDDWQFAYALPNGCIRPLAALTPGIPERHFSNTDTDAGSWPFLVEALDDGTAVLYTNVETATLRFIAKVTDTTKFSGLFNLAAARLLASYLAGPLIKGDTGAKTAQMHLEIFTKMDYPKAAAAAANSGHRSMYADFRPDSVSARGLTSRHWPR